MSILPHLFSLMILSYNQLRALTRTTIVLQCARVILFELPLYFLSPAFSICFYLSSFFFLLNFQNGKINKEIPGKYCNSISKRNPLSKWKSICAYDNFLPNATDRSGEDRTVFHFRLHLWQSRTVFHFRLHLWQSRTVHLMKLHLWKSHICLS